MSKTVVKRTRYGHDIHFKIINDNLMVLYKQMNDNYVPLTTFVEQNILTKHEIEILTEGSEEFGLRLIFKPTLIKRRK